jgi:haloalkane dehalogenase
LRQWQKPFLVAYGDGDPATAGWDDLFRELVPGARGVEHRTIAGAGHFIQEDRPRQLAQAVADFVDRH